jgi:hypothetical protein
MKLKLKPEKLSGFQSHRSEVLGRAGALCQGMTIGQKDLICQEAHCPKQTPCWLLKSR